VRYLKSTKDLKLTYGGGDKHGFEGYSDADGATQDHRHVISGFAVLVDGGAYPGRQRSKNL
jgi:hypothetical protein